MDPKDTAIDRVNVDFIPRLILIIFLQDVKVDQAEFGNISNIEPFYSTIRDGRFVVLVVVVVVVWVFLTFVSLIFLQSYQPAARSLPHSSLFRLLPGPG